MSNETFFEKTIVENSLIEDPINESLIKEEPIKNEPKNKVDEKEKDNKSKEPIYHWYIKLCHYHDYSTYQIRELSKYYHLDPMEIKSYDEFWKIVIKMSDIDERLSIIRRKWCEEYNRNY
jgi:hypothetical protein